MGTRITSDEDVVALFDSVSGEAFGPTMSDSDEAEAFIRFAEREADADLRTVPAARLTELYGRFRAEDWEPA